MARKLNLTRINIPLLTNSASTNKNLEAFFRQRISKHNFKAAWCEKVTHRAEKRMKGSKFGSNLNYEWNLTHVFNWLHSEPYSALRSGLSRSGLQYIVKVRVRRIGVWKNSASAGILLCRFHISHVHLLNHAGLWDKSSYNKTLSSSTQAPKQGCADTFIYFWPEKVRNSCRISTKWGERGQLCPSLTFLHYDLRRSLTAQKCDNSWTFQETYSQIPICCSN